MVAADINFTAFSLPPQNVDAEESILGGILLEADAIGRVSKVLSEESFYITSHQVIYRACQSLHAEGHPTDLTTVADWLNNNNLLSQAGGLSKLAELVERTVSAINIDRYAALVVDKHLRRQLIQASNEIAHLSYETHIPLETVFKQAEKKIRLCVPKDEVDHAVYTGLIKEVEYVVKSVFDPGFKQFKLCELSKKYKINAKSLEDIYFKHLVCKEYEPFQSWDELSAKHEGKTQKWLAGGLIPTPSTVLLHAPGGTGKTRFIYRFIQRLLMGEDWDFPINQASQGLIIQTDEAPEQTISTLKRQGFDQSLNLKFKTKWTVEQIALLRHELEQMEEKPAFLLIDNLTSVSRHSLFSENDVEYARPILLLNEIARDFDLAIVIIHHSNVQGNARGTSAIIASVDMELKLGVCPNDLTGEKRLLTIGKTRMRRPTQYQMEVDWDTNDWQIEQEIGEEPDGLAGKTKSRIISHLKANRGKVFESEELGHILASSVDNIRRCAGRLAADGIICQTTTNHRGKRGYFLPNYGGSGPDTPPDPFLDNQQTDRQGNPYSTGTSLQVLTASAKKMTGDPFLEDQQTDQQTDQQGNPCSVSNRTSSDLLIRKFANFSEEASEKNAKKTDQEISKAIAEPETVTQQGTQQILTPDPFADPVADRQGSDQEWHIQECDSCGEVSGDRQEKEELTEVIRAPKITFYSLSLRPQVGDIVGKEGVKVEGVIRKLSGRKNINVVISWSKGFTQEYTLNELEGLGFGKVRLDDDQEQASPAAQTEECWAYHPVCKEWLYAKLIRRRTRSAQVEVRFLGESKRELQQSHVRAFVLDQKPTENP
jgi:replicative DNA helicase